MLSRFVRAFLPRSKHLLISWLQLPSAVILEPKKIKSVTVFIVSPSICHEVIGLDAMMLVFWMLKASSFFTFLFHPHEEALWFWFTFCHKGDVICLFEIIDSSLGNLDSSLWFIQNDTLHDVQELMLLNCGVGEDSWESLGLQGDPTSPFWRRSALGFLWKEWC